MGTPLDLAQFASQGLFPIILTSTINSLLKTGRVSPVYSHSSLCVALSCELYLESQISFLEETVCLCLDSPSMYVLETISRVGAIVELCLIAHCLTFTRHSVSSVGKGTSIFVDIEEQRTHLSSCLKQLESRRDK